MASLLNQVAQQGRLLRHTWPVPWMCSVSPVTSAPVVTDSVAQRGTSTIFGRTFGRSEAAAAGRSACGPTSSGSTIRGR